MGGFSTGTIDRRKRQNRSLFEHRAIRYFPSTFETKIPSFHTRRVARYSSFCFSIFSFFTLDLPRFVAIRCDSLVDTRDCSATSCSDRRLRVVVRTRRPKHAMETLERLKTPRFTDSFHSRSIGPFLPAGLLSPILSLKTPRVLHSRVRTSRKDAYGYDT